MIIQRHYTRRSTGYSWTYSVTERDVSGRMVKDLGKASNLKGAKKLIENFFSKE